MHSPNSFEKHDSSIFLNVCKTITEYNIFDVFRSPCYLPFSTCNNQQFDFIIFSKYDSICNTWSNPQWIFHPLKKNIIFLEKTFCFLKNTGWLLIFVEVYALISRWRINNFFQICQLIDGVNTASFGKRASNSLTKCCNTDLCNSE